MAVGTRGRLIQDGADSIRMFGHDVPVRAAVETVPGLSGHADRGELLRWLGQLSAAPRATFLTHGEIQSANMLAEQLRRTRGWNTVVPKHGQTFELPEVVVL